MGDLSSERGRRCSRRRNSKNTVVCERSLPTDITSRCCLKNSITHQWTDTEKQKLAPQTWKNFPIQQQPLWPCPIELENVIETIRTLPPIVSSIEVLKFRKELGKIVEDGIGFVLHGGDCAEKFSDLRPEIIESKIRILLQMAGVLRHSTNEPCTIIARIAGQYGKPRSSNPKTEDPKVIFRGDNIHGYDVNERRPNPQRLVQGYFRSSATLNYIRTLLNDGYGDISHFPKSWNLSFLKNEEDTKRYSDVISTVNDNAFIHRNRKDAELKKTSNINISHEAILLNYEDGMTRVVDGKNYNLSAPFVWIGDRTRQLDHAHVEYIRHIENPVGIKVGPSMEPEELIMLLNLIWPKPELSPGKVTLITRYGESKIEQCLPRHIAAAQASGYKVLWMCDPCHGNTFVSAENGYKTRDVNQILGELSKCLTIHKQLGSRLAGVHLELTGEFVTECIGGIENIKETDVPSVYESYCDPRLNYSQSMEMSFQIARLLAEDKIKERVSKTNGFLKE